MTSAIHVNLSPLYSLLNTKDNKLPILISTTLPLYENDRAIQILDDLMSPVLAERDLKNHLAPFFGLPSGKSDAQNGQVGI